MDIQLGFALETWGRSFKTRIGRQGGGDMDLIWGEARAEVFLQAAPDARTHLLIKSPARGLLHERFQPRATSTLVRHPLCEVF
jgi:hypothetical protein